MAAVVALDAREVALEDRRVEDLVVEEEAAEEAEELGRRGRRELVRARPARRACCAFDDVAPSRPPSAPPEWTRSRPSAQARRAPRAAAPEGRVRERGACLARRRLYVLQCGVAMRVGASWRLVGGASCSRARRRCRHPAVRGPAVDGARGRSIAHRRRPASRSCPRAPRRRPCGSTASGSGAGAGGRGCPGDGCSRPRARSFAPWAFVRGADGRLWYAPGIWRDANGAVVDPPDAARARARRGRSGGRCRRETGDDGPHPARASDGEPQRRDPPPSDASVRAPLTKGSVGLRNPCFDRRHARFRRSPPPRPGGSRRGRMREPRCQPGRRRAERRPRRTGPTRRPGYPPGYAQPNAAIRRPATRRPRLRPRATRLSPAVSRALPPYPAPTPAPPPNYPAAGPRARPRPRAGPDRVRRWPPLGRSRCPARTTPSAGRTTATRSTESAPSRARRRPTASPRTPAPWASACRFRPAATEADDAPARLRVSFGPMPKKKKATKAAKKSKAPAKRAAKKRAPGEGARGCQARRARKAPSRKLAKASEGPAREGQAREGGEAFSRDGTAREAERGARQADPAARSSRSHRPEVWPRPAREARGDEQRSEQLRRAPALARRPRRAARRGVRRGDDRAPSTRARSASIRRCPRSWAVPFVETRADTEFAHGTDPSNPKTSTREPFPRT